MAPGEINGALLAYLGDAVIERLVRKRLVQEGGKLGEINKAADSLVRAASQSRAGEKILPLLTEEEQCAYRRGKNFHTSNTPKGASQSEYKKATALEALFGYLDLKGETERIELLINEAFFSE
jgi:ribonuclease-3 family protein